MLRRLLRSKTPPGTFVPYRVAVAVTVLVSVFAVIQQQAVTGAVGAFALVLIPAGFLFSYHRRHHRNILLKVALVVGLFAAFGGFLEGVRGALSIDDTRTPLTALFLWVQVLHSFDVPRRRDLGFSIASSVALVALAGSLAFTSGFVLVVIVYAAALIATFALGHLAELREGARAEIAEEVAPPARAVPQAGRALARPVAAMLAGTLACTMVVFIALPRFPGLRVASLPFSLANHNPIPGFDGSVVQPSQRGSSRGGAGVTGFNPDVYFGYGEQLDLRTRGTLSTELVLRVRAPEPALWRGQVFDHYDGVRWTTTDKDFDEIRTGSRGSIFVPRGTEPERRSGRELIQTFYVEKPLPNIVFHAHNAQEVFVPSSTVHMDDFRSVRLPFILEEDTIYSVISEVPASHDEITFAPAADPTDPRLERYLAMPDTLDGRFTELARSITGPHTTQAQKVAAVEHWLETTKRYRLDIPPDPPGRDPVDVFVFERDEGFCEQIASTMALMLRASGIPARIVTGFGPGERNLFTGYWEVRNSDAHAWVEVYYPSEGWIPYDPTFGVPLSNAANTTFMFGPLARISADILGLERIRDLAGSMGGTTAVAVPLALGLLALAALGAGVTRIRRRRRPHTPAERVIAAWFRVEDALARHGCRRLPHETVRDFASRARAQTDVDTESFTRFVDAFTRARYGPHTVSEAEAETLQTTAAEIAAELTRARVPVFAARR